MDDTSTAVADAPASSSTPSAPASAPTPSSESTPTTNRPSFKEALKIASAGDIVTEHQRRKGGRPPTPPSGEISTTGTPAATVPGESPVESLDPSAPTPPTTPKGAIATADHIKAVENARTKTRAEVEASFRQRFGDPESLSEITSWARRAATDRVGFLRDVITEALSDPQLGPQVRSLAGQTLRGSAPPAASKEPPAPDFQDGQGNAFYSAKKMAEYGAWLKDQITGELDGRVAPLEQTLESQQQREQAFEQQRQQTAWRDRTLSEVKQLPFFTEHEGEIKAAYAAMPPTSGHPAEESQALYKAYLQVVGAKRDALAQQKVLADLKKQAGASTLNPAATGAPVGIPKNVAAKTGGTFKDALAWAASQTRG